MINDIPKHLLVNIFKYFQTHKTYKKLHKSKQIDKYKIRLNYGIKTDIYTIYNLSKTNKYFRDFINNSEYFKLFWIIEYNSKLKFENKCVHSKFCNKSKCDNIGHYVNNKNDKNYSNILDKIEKNYTKIYANSYSHKVLYDIK